MPYLFDPSILQSVLFEKLLFRKFLNKNTVEMPNWDESFAEYSSVCTEIDGISIPKSQKQQQPREKLKTSFNKNIQENFCASLGVSPHARSLKNSSRV